MFSCITTSQTLTNAALPQLDVEETLSFLEIQLKNRLVYPYKWPSKQNNSFDQATNFVYDISIFTELMSYIRDNNIRDDNLFNYALNRWYNFWSARAVELVFSLSSKVKTVSYKTERHVDFKIEGIPFDHKTSVFPHSYHHSFNSAYKDPTSLIQWLYDHQSRGNRCDYGNRLFVVLYSNQGEHWKLKAEIALLRNIIEEYVKDFDRLSLHQFRFSRNELTLSDIIWVVQ